MQNPVEPSTYLRPCRFLLRSVQPGSKSLQTKKSWPVLQSQLWCQNYRKAACRLRMVTQLDLDRMFYSGFGLRCKTSLCFENQYFDANHEHFALGLSHNQSWLLRVGSEGRPESEVRRRVGVGLTEYTEEGNR